MPFSIIKLITSTLMIDWRLYILTRYINAKMNSYLNNTPWQFINTVITSKDRIKTLFYILRANRLQSIVLFTIPLHANKYVRDKVQNYCAPKVRLLLRYSSCNNVRRLNINRISKSMPHVDRACFSCERYTCLTFTEHIHWVSGSAK